MKLFFSIFFLFATFVSIFGRNPKIETVTVEDTYFIRDDETLKGARENAIIQARQKALAEKFGTVVSGSSYMVSNKSERGESDNFYSYHIADINGEWLETLYEEVIPSYDSKGNNVYNVKLKGKVREIINNQIDIKWTLLANGTDPEINKLRGSTFLEGDAMYLCFQSPVDGFLAIYLEDSEDESTAQCLLPYRGQQEGAFIIEGGKTYVFFSKTDAEDSLKHLVSRLRLSSRYDIDYNHLYLVFSPNPFWKAVDRDNTGEEATVLDRTGSTIQLMPRELKGKDFHKWLAKNRTKDKDLQYFHTILQIRKE